MRHFNPSEVQTSQSAGTVDDATGMCRVRRAMDWSRQAAGDPMPKKLWGELWYEGEVACLFADSNLGKSLLAVQIAEYIARERKVLLYDFELSAKQFQLRYSDEQGNLHPFPDNLLRAEILPETFSGDMEEIDACLLETIRIQSQHFGAGVIIIDNLQYICNGSETGEVAGVLMKNLINLKKEYGWSILVIGHTKKRDLSEPLDQNSLAGSKRLFNFFDSVFALGPSALDSSMRYLKQLKVRSSQLLYGEDNVIELELVKDGAMLKFEERGFSEEKKHLGDPRKADREALRFEVERLWREGRPQREIAKETKRSLGTVNKLVQQIRKEAAEEQLRMGDQY